jgi:demethylmenaquinone methyltransferase / 2-methoxy-6-polyprenyl-1,4-benzoquinol methylase
VTKPLPPHPVLHAHYATQQDRAAFVRSLFDRTAAQYDWANAVFFLGTGAWYRRRALAAGGLKPGMRVLDVAVGTGWLAEAAQRLLGSGAGIVGIDVSEGMLRAAARRVDIPLVAASAEVLPLADACVDFITMGYALRHVSDLAVVFQEFHRVLRPGGHLLMLEIGRPRGRLPFACAKFYFKHVLPAVCRLVSPRTSLAELMDYYWDTIESCVAPSAILAQLADSGFTERVCKTELGLFQAYRARRPAQF